MFVDAVVRRLSVSDVLVEVMGSRFCDVCAKFYMDTNYGRTLTLTDAPELQTSSCRSMTTSLACPSHGTT
jgi:hypothetical protein